MAVSLAEARGPRLIHWVAVGIRGSSLFHYITINPEVRVTKENRAVGALDNDVEGEMYKEHFLRKFVYNKAPKIMPGINDFVTDPCKN
ncbi:hypothetical protein DVH24_021535 [Malus domestica]|uniref:Uncharacterized protein n=1 Tax=Malus domestica TaxID=3750 RepID=A0A498K0C2_MALDO|nr:hypothetical protein DVH24_021535 [Malus domestica]